jgi:hypothetical protein
LPDPDHGSDQVCPEWPEYGYLTLSTSVCWIWWWLPERQKQSMLFKVPIM